MPYNYDGLEEFLFNLVYVPERKSTKVEKLKWWIFTKKQAESDRLAPTQEALRQAMFRAHYHWHCSVPRGTISTWLWPELRSRCLGSCDDLATACTKRGHPAGELRMYKGPNVTMRGASVARQDSTAQNYAPVISVRGVKILKCHSMMKRMKTLEMTRTMLKTSCKSCASWSFNYQQSNTNNHLQLLGLLSYDDIIVAELCRKYPLYIIMNKQMVYH